MSTSSELPVRAIGEGPSFGFGDRIGSATPGHVEAMRRAGDGFVPVFAQQSIREMTRTGRTPDNVMRDAVLGMHTAGWTAGTGADADHLKTPEDVESTAAVGFRFFTIDPSAHVDDAAETDDEETLRRKVDAVRDEVAPWLDDAVGRVVELDDGTRIAFTEEACLRCAAKLGKAIAFAVELGRHVVATCADRGGLRPELELSVDETETPTSLVEHWIAAERMWSADLPLRSVAPRFPGAFEKGIDHRGDRDELLRALSAHAAVARALGGHKLSLHSGSDKLSVYGPLARATRGRFHVKTAGTSYLEALRVAARRDPALFAAIVTFARERFATDRATYHLSATLDDPPAAGDSTTLEQHYLGDWATVPGGEGFTTAGRQIVHCTFGSVLGHPDLGPQLRALLDAEPELHRDLLADHFERHLRALRP